MATFRIGDRARIVNSHYPENRNLIGQELCITGGPYYSTFSGSTYYATDCVGAMGTGLWFEDNLEPILPSAQELMERPGAIDFTLNIYSLEAAMAWTADDAT
jgi:hypothetical protein